MVGSELRYQSTSYAQTNSPQILTKTLSLGTSDAQVSLLKQILAIDSQISPSSSLSTEPATYFGPKTRQSVILFQEKYKNDILTPLGLAKGTGVVASMTRKKLNELLQNLKTANVSPTTATSTLHSANLAQFFATSPTVRLFRTDKFQIAPGGTLILEGKGFSTTTNTVMIGDTQIQNLPSADSEHITIKLPSNLTYGDYLVNVMPKNGLKSSRDPAVHILVTANPQLPPQITSVTPANAEINGTLTLSGSGFTAQNNTVVTGFGTLTGLPATGGIITIDLKRFASLPILAANPKLKGVTIPMWMYIQNANGVSFKEFTFTIKIN